jgi:hypothetical protein
MEDLAHSWVDLIRQFERWTSATELDLLAAYGEPDNGPHRVALRSSLRDVANMCYRCGLSFTGLYASTLITDKLPHFRVNGGFSPSDFQKEISILRRRFDDETSDTLLIFLNDAKFKYYGWCDVFVFKTAVTTKYPMVTFDIDEAGKCFALGRHDACVFHVMRILQLGINSLAKSLGIAFEYANWDRVLNDIEAAIKRIERGDTKTPDWRHDQTFYSEAALQFRHFKDAWRNHAIHARVNYNQEKAEQILRHVAEFMEHLANHLAE